MKQQQVSPVVAIIAVVVVLGIAAFAWTRMSGGGAGSKEGDKPPGMPSDVAEKFKSMPGGSPTGGGMPTGPSGGGMPTGPGGGGGMTAPPGGGGGMTAPPGGR